MYKLLGVEGPYHTVTWWLKFSELVDDNVTIEMSRRKGALVEGEGKSENQRKLLLVIMSGNVSTKPL